jgi:hypothetical protein
MAKEIGTCEACPNVGPLAKHRTMLLCEDCYTKEILAGNEPKSDSLNEVQIEPSTTPIDDRLRKAYIDKFNTLAVSGMSHEDLKYHIADLQDMVKVLNTQVQAAMDVDEEWSSKLNEQQRAALSANDKKYRAKARPAMNADGTKKVKVASAPKEVIVGDVGDKAFENLVEKLLRTGMDRKTAETMIRGLKGKK